MIFVIELFCMEKISFKSFLRALFLPNFGRKARGDGGLSLSYFGIFLFKSFFIYCVQ